MSQTLFGHIYFFCTKKQKTERAAKGVFVNITRCPAVLIVVYGQPVNPGK